MDSAPGDVQEQLGLLKLGSLLTAVGEERTRSKEYRAAADAYNEALSETVTYLEGLRSGTKSADQETERELSRLWIKASTAVNEFDAGLANKFFIKGQGWLDPSVWDNPQYREYGVGIDDMRAAFIQFNEKRHAQNQERVPDWFPKAGGVAAPTTALPADAKLTSDEPKMAPLNEAIVDRIVREVARLRDLFGRNWLLGSVVLIVMLLYIAHEFGFFKLGSAEKKDDLASEILALSKSYVELSEKYQSLQAQDNKNEENKLRNQLAPIRAQLQDKAKNPDLIKEDRTVFEAVDTWRKCGQNSGSASNKCYEILGSILPPPRDGELNGAINQTKCSGCLPGESSITTRRTVGPGGKSMLCAEIPSGWIYRGHVELAADTLGTAACDDGPKHCNYDGQYQPASTVGWNMPDSEWTKVATRSGDGGIPEACTQFENDSTTQTRYAAITYFLTPQ
jgi:hypothetical protein